jgi:glycosyltransferase involved in cell wall biosynthesis
LSCYLYRCEAWWKEGLGRDLFGAMALGVPVLCPRRSIHAEYIRDGVDGILYDDDAGALEALAVLGTDPKRRLALGAAARESARRMFDPGKIAFMYRRLVAGA